MGDFDKLLILVKKRKLNWPHLKVFWLSNDNTSGHSERIKKRQTEEVGRYIEELVGMDFASLTRPAKEMTGWKGIL